jgi:paraquat-inducible protein A
MFLQNLVACSDCDMLHRIATLSPGESARCFRCGNTLTSSKTDSLDRTLSLTVAAAIRTMEKTGK